MAQEINWISTGDRGEVHAIRGGATLAPVSMLCGKSYQARTYNVLAQGDPKKRRLRELLRATGFTR